MCYWTHQVHRIGRSIALRHFIWIAYLLVFGVFSGGLAWVQFIRDDSAYKICFVLFRGSVNCWLAFYFWSTVVTMIERKCFCGKYFWYGLCCEEGSPPLMGQTFCKFVPVLWISEKSNRMAVSFAMGLDVMSHLLELYCLRRCDPHITPLKVQWDPMRNEIFREMAWFERSKCGGDGCKTFEKDVFGVIISANAKEMRFG